MGFELFGIMEVVIGVYVLYGAITGKGQLYKNDYIKKGQEALYKKYMRLTSWPVGGFTLIAGSIDVYRTSNPDAGNIVSTLFWVFFALSAVSIAIMMVLSIRMTDRKKQKSATKVQTRQAPRAAYYFDEDDNQK